MELKLKLNQYKLDDFDKKQKKSDLVNSKISVILPELMCRNLKLGERLKNKLKVSTLFNNIEHRNKKYLKGFIFSSNKRAKDLKTGLEMNKAIRQSSKKLTLLRNQMKDDLILRNSDILLKEKKLLSENTEQETHLKINDFIHTIKNTLKPSSTPKLISTKKLFRSMSDDEITKAKDIMGNKIIKEENEIQEIINNYLSKMKSCFDNNNYEKNRIKIKKDFNKYTENMYLRENIKLINYTRAIPEQIKDQENANLIRIKKILYPSNFDIDINEKKENKTFRKNSSNIILKSNSSMNDINKSIKKKKTLKEIQNKDEKLNNVDANGKDTMEVLNNLVDQGEFLTERMQKKLDKVNSLIEIKLPYPSNYELILNYIKKHPNLRKDEKNFEIFTPKSESKISKGLKISPYLRSKLISIKEDIAIKNNEYLEKKLKDSKSLPYIKIKNNFNNNINNINRNHKSKNDKVGENNNSNNISMNKSHIVFITSKK